MTPASAPGCAGDFDGSGRIAVADIFGYLNAFFAGEARSDTDRSGSTEVADLIGFLAAWFAGC